MSDTQYDPVGDIPDQTGRVFVITGGTSGIGKTTILRLAARNPSAIIFTGRSLPRADSVIAETSAFSSTKVSFVACDMSDLESVKQCGKSIKNLTDRIDVLITNAGVFTVPHGLTKQGYEIYFGTNHLAHAALIKILLPILVKTSNSPATSVRIITLASESLQLAPSEGVLFPKLKTALHYAFWYLPSLRRYAHSKLATRLYSMELSKRNPEILSVAIHPGSVTTEGAANANWFIRVIFAVTPGKLSPDQGAWNTLWAATNTKDLAAMQGGWFFPVGKAGPEVQQRWLDQAEELWEWTEKELALNGIA